MPKFFGRSAQKDFVINDLGDIYKEIEKTYQIPQGDFPDLVKMQELLRHQDFDKFTSLKPHLLDTVEHMLTHDIAEMMALIPHQSTSKELLSNISGGVFVSSSDSPFGYHQGEGADAGRKDKDWIVNTRREKYDAKYKSLGPVNGKVLQSRVRDEMLKSKLPNTVLGKIWRLADVDQDGLLDADEFALAMYLIDLRLEGHDLPIELPYHLVPPSKREVKNQEFATP